MIGPEEKVVIKRNIISLLGMGSDNRKVGKELAAMVHSDPPGRDRNFRFFVLELIDEGFPIASSNTTPAGYFMAVTSDEVKVYAKSLRDRAKKNFIRRRDFLRAARSILQPTQLPLI